MPHMALVGDSIFDNRFYVGNEPDVITHLRNMLPEGWSATLCAIDGSTTTGVHGQVGRIPKETTHIVVSIGGNDALMNQDILYSPSESGISILEKLDRICEEFGKNYRKAIKELTALNKRMILCTIYNANLPDNIATAAKAAISVFNDRIYLEANALGLPVLELRKVCTERSDYANSIEPSGKGGAKIARAIMRVISQMEKK
jgi:lysophospholipase L1-like esterase